MAKIGSKTGSGQGRVRKMTDGVFVRCLNEQKGLRCITRTELCYPKEHRGTEKDYVYRCGKKDCPVRPKYEAGVHVHKK